MNSIHFLFQVSAVSEKADSENEEKSCSKKRFMSPQKGVQVGTDKKSRVHSPKVNLVKCGQVFCSNYFLCVSGCPAYYEKSYTAKLS